MKGVKQLIALRAIRKSKGISIVDLAKASGISRATIHKIEGSDGDVSTKTLKALADALDVKITDFFVD